MNARRLAIYLLLIGAACRDAKPPTEISGPPGPSKIISDGAHGGNKDFFFLPPLVSDPSHDPNFEPGQFNATLASSLTVEVCQLATAPVDAQGQPVVTDCAANVPLKAKFPAGTVTLQNPPDGFYQVVWHVGESNLDVTKFYRIKVLVEGASEPFGVADVDPVSSMKELRNARTGETIPLNENSTLPIKFRIEHGGGSVLCGDAALCFSTTVSNSSPTGSQTVTVDGGAGSVAGARFPNGWLPADGPQNVVVTIAQVDIGTTDPVTGESTKPCHLGLRLQQFPGCFNFSTTPQLAPIDRTGREFATPVTVAVCYSLQGSRDPREKYAEMYSSGPNEPPHALPDASDEGILSAATRNCSAPEVIGSAPSTGVSQLARASWRKIRTGVGSIFGVKTAYGVDLGLGGISTAFSNIGPAISATIEPVGSTEITRTGPGNVQVYVRLIGSNHHDGEHQNSVGLPDLPVHFQLADANSGAIAEVGSDVGAATQLDIVTDSLPIDVESAVSGGGYAGVNWAVPTTAGVYHLTVDGAALGGPITFTLVVTNPVNFSVLQGNWLNDNPNTGDNPEVDISVDGSAVSVHAFGACSPTNCDWGTAPADLSQWNSLQKLTAVWNQGFVIVTQTITFVSPTQVSIQNSYDFQPPDTRTDFTSTSQTFTKQTFPLSYLLDGWFNEANIDNPTMRTLHLGYAPDQSVAVGGEGACDDPNLAGTICSWSGGVVDVSQWTSSSIATFSISTQFSTRNVTIHMLSRTLIHVTTVTHYTDGSGRADYTAEEDLVLST